jgi:thymidylate kinase
MVVVVLSKSGSAIEQSDREDGPPWSQPSRTGEAEIRATRSSFVVSFSGIDGAGKTTIARAMARNLGGLYRKQVHGVRFERLTSQLPVPHRPSDYSQEFAQAYCSDFIAYANRCRPNRLMERVVIYDRWKTCVRAFAAAFGSETSRVDERLKEVPDADFDFLLDTPVEVALERLCKRDHLDADETEEILSRLRTAYLELAANNDRIVVIDTSAATASTVFAQAMSRIGQPGVDAFATSERPTRETTIRCTQQSLVY